MITKYLDVASENPTQFIWKSLRYYLDKSYVVERLNEIHKPDAKYKRDVEKNASQLGYCIRQAEEYFKAASQVGLATRPTLMYYGAVSLSKALTLLRLDGTHSFDALREKNRHQHHGLDLIQGFKQYKAGHGPAAFFGSISCRCHIHEQQKTPWGHFPLFYDSLAPTTHRLKFSSITFVGISSPLTSTDHGLEECACKRSLAEVAGHDFNVLQLLKDSPDLHVPLLQYKIAPATAQGDVEVEFSRTSPAFTNVSITADTKPRVIATKRYTVRCSGTQLQHFKTLFATREIKTEVSHEASDSIQFHISWAAGEDFDSEIPYWFPIVVDDISAREYLIEFPDTYLLEPVSQVIVLFCLGMIARYHADVWMHAVDEDVTIAELVDSFLNVCARKFPNLILNQLSDTHHHIHLT